MAWESVLFPGVVIPWSIISEGRCSETETRGEKLGQGPLLGRR